MANSNRKTTLSGPGQPGQTSSRASRSASNVPPASSPAGPRSARGSGVYEVPQAEEDPNQTLQTEEGNPVIARRESRASSSNAAPSAAKSSVTEVVKGIIAKNKKGKEKEPHLFSHVPHLKSAQAYEETLSESLTRCHHPWDPDSDSDPLAEFGAEDGALPGLTLSQSMPFRDIVIRWMAQHQNLEWQSLEDYTQMLCAVSLTQEDVELKPNNGSSYYSLRYTFLIHTYEVTLGITQIITTIDRLLARSLRRSFSIDKGYLILKQLAMGDDADHIQLSFYTLQARCKGAVNHIRQALNSIKTTFGQFHNAFTNHSYHSTLSDIRSNYGLLPPRMEVARHIIREDYQAGLPEHLREYKDRLVEEWVRSGRMINSQPYQRKPAYYPQLQEDRSDSSRTWSRAQGSLPKDSKNTDRNQPSVFGSVSSVDRRRLPPPTSISVALNRNHPLSHFPELNSNTTGAADKGFDDDDPHNPWTTVHSGRSRNVHLESAHPSKNTRFANQQEERQSTRGEQRSVVDFTNYSRSRKNGGPPNGGEPPDGDGPPGGGGPSGARGSPRRTNGDPSRSGRHQSSFSRGSPGGDPHGGGPGFSIDPEEEKSKGEWQLNNKISIGTIPQWDGSPATMIDYIMEIALLARLSKRMFKEIGQIAPIRWTGSAKGWWMTLPRADQAYFSQDWECLVSGMRDHFMNDVWLNDRGIEFDAMRFRRGSQYARETPEEYFNRRIRLNMVLHPEEVDGTTVTHRLMNRQPILWGSILNTTSCPSIVHLTKLAKAMEANLIAQYYNGLRIEKYKSANTAEVSTPEEAEKSAEEIEPESSKEAHAVSRGVPRKRTDWPKGRTIAGYSYSRDDSVVSKVAPPGPCFICLSPKHFFRDCPHNARFFGKAAHSVDVMIDQDELKDLDLEYYNTISTAMTSTSDYVTPDSESEPSSTTEVVDRRNRNERRREKFDMKAKRQGKQKLELPQSENRAARRKLKLHKLAATVSSRSPPTLSTTRTIEEDLFSDEEDIVDYPEPEASDSNSLSNKEEDELSSPASSSSSSSSLPFPSAMRSEHRKVSIEEVEDPEAPPLAYQNVSTEEIEDPESPSPAKVPNDSRSNQGERKEFIPDDSEIIMAAKKETKPEGLGSLGTQALHIKAYIQSIGRGEVKARLDSGADITLMSEEFWKEMGTLMKPKEGLRMKLYHLTGHAKVLGYVKTCLYTQAMDGAWICFELEAYVVQGMKVPLLLGEDFQTAYELHVKRHATGHCEVTVGESSRIIPASSAHSVDLGFEIRQAYLSKSFIRARTARRSRARDLKGMSKELQPVYATEDVLIEAGRVKMVRVTGAIKERKDWLVERVIVGKDSTDILAAPFTWITSDNPILPVANPGTRPLYIRKGEIVGRLADPSSYLDHPDEDSLHKYVASAEAIRAVIIGTLKDQDLAKANGLPPESSDSKLEEEENWGPKTTAVPEDLVTGPVSELVNLGPDIPADILPRLEGVLQKNAEAFGVDGRLGHVEAKVSIPLRPGAMPTSLPMYGASTAKREVIDHQVKAWFEAGVIELSVSPWGFPVIQEWESSFSSRLSKAQCQHYS